jgi:hypothetical protein
VGVFPDRLRKPSQANDLRIGDLTTTTTIRAQAPR